MSRPVTSSTDIIATISLKLKACRRRRRTFFDVRRQIVKTGGRLSTRIMTAKGEGITVPNAMVVSQTGPTPRDLRTPRACSY